MTNVVKKVSINGQVVPFGGGGSEGQEVVYLTQAEYDALPASKLTDGKIYKVKTTGVPGGVLTAGAGIDITSNTISADMSTAVYDNTTSGATATNMQDAMDEVFQSVSNGKTLIAAAITDKGVSTAASDSFQTMATNIESLMVGGKYCDNSIGDLVYEVSAYRGNSESLWGDSTKQEEDGHDIYYFFFVGGGQNVSDHLYTAIAFRIDSTTNRIKTYTRSGLSISGLNTMIIEKNDNVIYVGNRSGSTNNPIIEYNTVTGEFSNSTTYLNGTDIKESQGRTTAMSGYATTGGSATVGGRTFIISIIGDSFDTKYTTYVTVK